MTAPRVRTEFEALVPCDVAAREARLRELATTDRRLAEEVRSL